MKTLIIGHGEIGSALHKVLGEHYDVWVVDPLYKVKQTSFPKKFGVMHVCIPPIADYVKVVKAYQKKYRPTYTVIHGTVPVGTSRRCAAYYSPVRGVHPRIDIGLKTFVKFLAPHNGALHGYFEKAGIKIEFAKRQDDLEALKIWDTTYYGWNIIFEKLVYEWCKKVGVDYNTVYVRGNLTYNEGYKKLGRSEVVRPVLKHVDGEIGGHCVINNLALFNSPIADFIKKHNEEFKVRKVQSKTSGSR